MLLNTTLTVLKDYLETNKLYLSCQNRQFFLKKYNTETWCQKSSTEHTHWKHDRLVGQCWFIYITRGALLCTHVDTHVERREWGCRSDWSSTFPWFFPSCWCLHLLMLLGVMFWACCKFPPTSTSTLHISALPEGRPGVLHTDTHPCWEACMLLG